MFSRFVAIQVASIAAAGAASAADVQSTWPVAQVVLAAPSTGPVSTTAGPALSPPTTAAPTTSPSTGKRASKKASGGPCARGTKTIFFDLGNAAFRSSEAAGRSPGAAGLRVGGTVATGAWAAGCFDPAGYFQEEAVQAGESVRLLLLNPRTDLEYSLLFANGSLQPAERTSLAPLDQSSPICGTGRLECDVDASALDDLLGTLNGTADALVRGVARASGDAPSFAGKAQQCAASLAKAPACADLAAIGLSAPSTGQDWWNGYLANRGTFLGTLDLYRSRAKNLCDKWASRYAALRQRYFVADRRDLDRLLDLIHAWSDDSLRVLQRPVDVRELLTLLGSERAERPDGVDGLKVAAASGAVSGLQAWHEIQSYHYYRSNYRTFCAGLDGRDLDEHALDQLVSDTLNRAREVTRLLDHAYSARAFGLRSMDANTEVIVTVYATAVAPPSGTAALAPTPAATAAPAGKAAEAPIPFQFSYRVEGVDPLAFSLGTAVALHFEKETTTDASGATHHSTKVISPKPDALLFLNWRLWAAKDFICERLGLQVGVGLKQALDAISGHDPGKVNVYGGFVLWPIPTIALSVGLVDNLERPEINQLGVYFGVSGDIPALWRAWQGPKQVLAQ